MSLTKSHPPSGVLRWFLRAPLWFYRIGLGGFLGKRFMMFKHIGHKTGLIRETLVEVVYHDTENDRYYIASGWGEKAHWLRNIAKNPAIDVVIGRRKFHANTSLLDKTEGAKALTAYAEKYPLAFRKLSQAMLGEELTADKHGAEQLAESVPIIAVDPEPEGTR